MNHLTMSGSDCFQFNLFYVILSELFILNK
jgi:hypothetical protein